jgi:hypothetical protein
MARRHVKNKRNQLVVDKNFQYKISVYFIITAAVTSIAVLYSLLSVHRQNIQIFFKILGPDAESFAEAFQTNETILLYITIGTFLVLSLALFYVGLLYSQRIIGPILRINSDMKNAVNTNFKVKPISVRKNDYMHHVVEIYNKFISTTKRRNENYVTHSEEIIPRLIGINEDIQKKGCNFSLDLEIDFLRNEVNREKNA